jgi:hypothetical protein
MTRPVIFNRTYLAFGADAEPYQRADDVGYAIAEFLWFDGRPFYPATALASAQIASVRLSECPSESLNDDNLDLIFRMREAGGGSFFEIVLRSDGGTTYGGWLWGRSIQVLDELVNGHRVLEAILDTGEVRFEYCRTAGRYQGLGPLPVDKAAS